MNHEELAKLANYLQLKFKNPDIKLKLSNSDSSMVEVYMGTEFIGTLYKDEDEGETSYDFNMSIIDIDLQ